METPGLRRGFSKLMVSGLRAGGPLAPPTCTSLLRTLTRWLHLGLALTCLWLCLSSHEKWGQQGLGAQ